MVCEGQGKGGMCTSVVQFHTETMMMLTTTGDDDVWRC